MAPETPSRARGPLRTCLVAILLLLVPLGRDALAEADEVAAAPTPTGWYVTTIVSDESAYRITHYWSKGASMRAETMIGLHPIVTIVRGNRYWVYDELRRVGIEIERSATAIAEDAKRDRPFGNDLDELIRLQGERVETETVNGMAVEVWRVTNASGRRSVWVTAGEPRLPLRVEQFDRESGDTMMLEYSNWTTASDLPDTAFEPPSDLSLQRFDYQAYLKRSGEELRGRAPVLYPHLLHGARPR